MTAPPIRPDVEAEPRPSDDLDTDQGPSTKTGRDPERRCIATGETQTQSQMIRVVRGPDGAAIPDIAGRLPGRGAWITSNRASVERAVARNAFARAFKAPTRADAGMAGQIEALLLKRCLDYLGLARRAGDVVVGFDQVRAEIRRARPAYLVEAADGAADGRSKLVGLAKALYLDPREEADPEDGMPPIATCFSARELGMALGRDRVIHGVVKEGRFAQTWTVEVARLSGFRPAAPEGSSSGTDR